MSYIQVLLNKTFDEIYKNGKHQIDKEETLLTFQELFTSYPYFHYAAAIMSEQDIEDIANVDDKEILLPYFNRAITTSDIKYKAFNSRDVTYPFRYYKCLSNFYYLLLRTSSYVHPKKSFIITLNDFFKKDGHVNGIYESQIELNKEMKSYFHRRDIELPLLVQKTIRDGNQNSEHVILKILQNAIHENLEVLIMELYAIKQLHITLEITNTLTSDLNMAHLDYLRKEGLEITKYDIDIEKHQNALIDNLFNEHLYSVVNGYIHTISLNELSDDDTKVLDNLLIRTIEVLDYYEVKTTDVVKEIRSFVETIKDYFCLYRSSL